MSRQTWMQTLAAADAAGTPISNSVTQVSIVPPETKIILPASAFYKGAQFRVEAYGQISNVVTTPGTLLFQLLFGAVGVFSPAAFALNVVAKTNVSWELKALLTVRAVGAGTSANLIGQGSFTSESVVGAAAGQPLTLLLPASAPAVGSGFDSTTAQQVDLQAKFSVATSPTNITCTQFSFESKN